MSKYALITSSDISLINELNEQLLTRDYSVHIEKSQVSSILAVLVQPVEFVIIDIDSLLSGSLDFIKVLKQIRPQIPLIVLSSDHTIEQNAVLKEQGIFYISLKPINALEFTMVIDAINLLNSKKAATYSEFLNYPRLGDNP